MESEGLLTRKAYRIYSEEPSRMFAKDQDSYEQSKGVKMASYARYIKDSAEYGTLLITFGKKEQNVFINVLILL